MTTQLEMPLPAPDTQDVDLLVNLLDHHGGWLSAADCCKLFQRTPNENSKREIRKMVEKSNGWIISGQKGYCHLCHASAEEANHAENWIEHQAKLMGDKVRAIRRNRHQLAAGYPPPHLALASPSGPLSP
jgi:hypothetical protein